MYFISTLPLKQKQKKNIIQQSVITSTKNRTRTQFTKRRRTTAPKSMSATTTSPRSSDEPRSRRSSVPLLVTNNQSRHSPTNTDTNRRIRMKTSVLSVWTVTTPALRTRGPPFSAWFQTRVDMTLVVVINMVVVDTVQILIKRLILPTRVGVTIRRILCK